MIPLGIAAGDVKLPAYVEKLVKIPSDILSSVTLGSYTLEPREGNPGNPYYQTGNGTSLNSLGMPNPGITAARPMIREMAEALHESGKQVRVSIAGFSIAEYVQMTQALRKIPIDELELNLGCPNVYTDLKQKPIFSFDPKLVRETVRRVATLHDGPVAVKLSPYSDPQLLERVAGELEGFPFPLTIVTCNTFPNGSAFMNDGASVISVNDGFAGIGGTALHEIALGQVRQFRKLLGDKWNIIGVGGVSNGAALQNFEFAGANSCQVGTAYFDALDERIFGRIVEEYLTLSE